MLRGLYASAAALLVHGLRHETAASNLANAQTPGYRAGRLALTPFAELLVGRLAGGDAVPLGRLPYGVAAAELVRVPAPGPLRQTGRPLDVALVGDGFLVVATPAGERYTRDGRLSVAADGRLVDAGGRPVLGEAGEIRVPPGAVPTIDEDGTVRAGDQVLGRLRRVRFADPGRLRLTEGGLLQATDASGPPLPAADTRVRAGLLELANVDPVTETVELLHAFRAFEAAHRVIRAHDETLALATGELARL